MGEHGISRRMVILGLGAMAAMPVRSAVAAGPAIHVLKDPGCGCCGAWIELLQAEGFTVTTDDRAGEEMYQAKVARGIPGPMMSCHTAEIEGYVVEGHVPAADIMRLLADRPDAIGLAVPGMPFGSPGMGPEDQREAYDVHLIRRDGSTTVFARYDAA